MSDFDETQVRLYLEEMKSFEIEKKSRKEAERRYALEKEKAFSRDCHFIKCSLARLGFSGEEILEKMSILSCEDDSVQEMQDWIWQEKRRRHPFDPEEYSSTSWFWFWLLAILGVSFILVLYLV